MRLCCYSCLRGLSQNAPGALWEGREPSSSVSAPSRPSLSKRTHTHMADKREREKSRGAERTSLAEQGIAQGAGTADTPRWRFDRSAPCRPAIGREPRRILGHRVVPERRRRRSAASVRDGSPNPRRRGRAHHSSVSAICAAWRTPRGPAAVHVVVPDSLEASPAGAIGVVGVLTLHAFSALLFSRCGTTGAHCARMRSLRLPALAPIHKPSSSCARVRISVRSPARRLRPPSVGRC